MQMDTETGDGGADKKKSKEADETGQEVKEQAVRSSEPQTKHSDEETAQTGQGVNEMEVESSETVKHQSVQEKEQYALVLGDLQKGDDKARRARH